jgi:hypothetical protein
MSIEKTVKKTPQQQQQQSSDDIYRVLYYMCKVRAPVVLQCHKM